MPQTKDEAVYIEKPHPGQRIILDSKKRFRVLACGRRFGKTVVAKRRIILQGYQNAKKIGYFAPTYKMLNETWREIAHTLASVTLKKDEHHKQILTLTGGVIDFWSLDNPDAGRGREYNEIICDEAAYVQDLEDIWNKVIRATLINRRGTALFLSTPNGYDNDFKKFFDKQDKDPEYWQSFQMPSSVNPRIPAEELEMARLELPGDAYNQEYLAQFVIFNGKLFADQFDFTRHIGSKAEYNENIEVFLSFDFNITISVLAIQSCKNYIQCLKEYHQEGWDLERTCNEIITDYPGAKFVVNGDASGNSRSALTSGNQTAYQLIKTFLGMSFSHFRVPTINPSYINSRLECNFILKNDNMYIHPSCKRLIKDIMSVKIDDRQSIEVWKKKNPLLGHIFDCWRYHLHAEHSQKLKWYKPNKAVA